MAEKLVKTACELARHVYRLQAHAHWEWPKNNLLWNMTLVKKTRRQVEAEGTEVSTAVAELTFEGLNTHMTGTQAGCKYFKKGVDDLYNTSEV